MIAASHVDLAAAVEQGRFRQDLFYRLNVVVLGAPPLRDRLDDLPLLAAHFLKKHGGNHPPTLSPEALEVMAIDPVRFLVVPRVLALLLALPLLTILGNCVGIAGGWTVCRFILGMSTEGYLLHAARAADAWDLYSGLIKSAAFAWIVGTIACRAGLGVEGGAAGVGRATTQSVVTGLLAMLVANAVLTALFFFGE